MFMFVCMCYIYVRNVLFIDAMDVKCAPISLWLGIWKNDFYLILLAFVCTERDRVSTNGNRSHLKIENHDDYVDDNETTITRECS